MPSSSPRRSEPVSIGEALRLCIAAIGSSTPTPGSEAETILSHLLDMPRTQIYLERSRQLTEREYEAVIAVAARRADGEPLQYILGVQQFRGLNLEVGEGVLVPRPETEYLVELCLNLLKGRRKPRVADIGTGSGAVALSLAAESEAHVVASDISSAAISWAERNLGRYPDLRTHVSFVQGDLFSSFPPEWKGDFDLVVSNPPYLAEAELEESADDVKRWEPRVATMAGPSGMELIVRIASQALEWLAPLGWLALEIDPRRLESTLREMSSRYFDVEAIEDLAGRPRVVIGRSPPQ